MLSNSRRIDDNSKRYEFGALAWNSRRRQFLRICRIAALRSDSFTYHTHAVPLKGVLYIYLWRLRRPHETEGIVHRATVFGIYWKWLGALEDSPTWLGPVANQLAYGSNLFFLFSKIFKRFGACPSPRWSENEQTTSMWQVPIFDRNPRQIYQNNPGLRAGGKKTMSSAMQCVCNLSTSCSICIVTNSEPWFAFVRPLFASLWVNITANELLFTTRKALLTIQVLYSAD